MKQLMPLLLGGTLVISGQAAITDGLIGHWSFDETSGLTVNDSSGKANHGTVSNAAGDNPTWGAGKVGGALEFRGPDNGADVVSVPDFTKPTSTFSISAWVNADPRDGTWPQSAIVESGLGSGGPFGLVIRPKNLDQAFGPLGNTSTDANEPINVSETVGFPVSSWQHVGVVADGTKIRLYRNGVEVASADYATPLAAPAGTALGIGGILDESGVASGGFWQGKIDDLGLWTTALTSAQMASIFNAGQAGKDLTQADQFQNAAPTISAQPQSQTRFAGEAAALSVTAAGNGLTYQWKLNGQDIAGATNSIYNLPSVQTSDAGTYTVVISNSGGTITSDPATLAVQGAGLSAGLVGYWKFDETTGTTAADSSSSTNAGELVNYLEDNSQWIKGQVGGGLQFGGPDAQQYVRIPDVPKATSTLTIALWVWAESRPTWASFVKNWGGSQAGQFHFGLFGGEGQENIYIRQKDGRTPNVSEPIEFPLGSWEHVAVVCEGTTVRLYRNGAQVAQTNYNGTLVQPPMDAVGIGVKLNDEGTEADPGNPGYWHGKMDDVAIWNRGLSASEIQAIYQAGLQGKGVLEAQAPASSVQLSYTSTGTSLVLSWPADATGFTLESSDRLPGSTWSPVPGVQNNRVTVTIGAGNQFYRLRR